MISNEVLVFSSVVIGIILLAAVFFKHLKKVQLLENKKHTYWYSNVDELFIR
jgi:hypothetical protein